MPWPNDDIVATHAENPSFQNSATETLVLVPPYDIAADDLLLLFVNFDPFIGVSTDIPFTHIGSSGDGLEETQVYYRPADGSEVSVDVTMTAAGANSGSIVFARARALPVLSAAGGYLDGAVTFTSGATAANLSPSADATTLLTLVIVSGDAGVTSDNPDDVVIDGSGRGALNDRITLFARDIASGGAGGATYTSTSTVAGTISLAVALSIISGGWIVGSVGFG